MPQSKNVKRYKAMRQRERNERMYRESMERRIFLKQPELAQMYSEMADKAARDAAHLETLINYSDPALRSL